jgi:hypothetical protein
MQSKSRCTEQEYRPPRKAPRLSPRHLISFGPFINSNYPLDSSGGKWRYTTIYGMRIMPSPCANSHARINCPTTQPLFQAKTLKSSINLYRPVTNPRLRGLYATTAIASSRYVLRMFTFSTRFRSRKGCIRPALRRWDRYFELGAG